MWLETEELSAAKLTGLSNPHRGFRLPFGISNCLKSHVKFSGVREGSKQGGCCHTTSKAIERKGLRHLRFHHISEQHDQQSVFCLNKRLFVLAAGFSECVLFKISNTFSNRRKSTKRNPFKFGFPTMFLFNKNIFPSVQIRSRSLYQRVVTYLVHGKPWAPY